MKATFDQDNDLEQGCARITLLWDSGEIGYEEGDSVALGYDTPNGVEYLRADGREGPAGRPEPLKLRVKPAVGSGRAAFEIQPAYVQHMRNGGYEVCLVDAAGQVKERVRGLSVYDPVLPELEGTNTLLASYLDEAKPEATGPQSVFPASPASPETAQATKQETPQSAGKDGGGDAGKIMEVLQQAEAVADVPPAGGAAKQQDTEVAPVEETAETQEAKLSSADTPAKKSKLPLIAAAAALVLLLAGGAFFMMRGGDSGPSAEQKQTAVEQKAAAEKKAAEEAARAAAEKKAAEEAARAETEKKAAEKAARADAKNRVAEFFAGQRGAEAAMKLADDLDTETSEQQDAVFRLYYYAAGEGSQQAARRYAECVDPSLPAWGTIRKDGAEAWYYYGQAPDGESARARLKQWTEQAAGRGDPAAANWLKEMK